MKTKTRDFGVVECRPTWDLRQWVYLQSPRTYEMAGCECGNNNPQWSEYRHRLWCQVCEIDFTPVHAGIFDGPVPVQGSQLMGLCFDTFDLYSETVIPFGLK